MHYFIKYNENNKWTFVTYFMKYTVIRHPLSTPADRAPHAQKQTKKTNVLLLRGGGEPPWRRGSSNRRRKAEKGWRTAGKQGGVRNGRAITK